jgi:hypothetical protein
MTQLLIYYLATTLCGSFPSWLASVADCAAGISLQGVKNILLAGGTIAAILEPEDLPAANFSGLPTEVTMDPLRQHTTYHARLRCKRDFQGALSLDVRDCRE